MNKIKQIADVWIDEKRKAYLEAIQLLRQKIDMPHIICLCGSTRFYKEYVQANYDFTGKGYMVLTVGFFGHAQDNAHGQTVGITPAKKGFLDALHKRKIDLADSVYVINVGGYIGDSTRSEIEHARALHKPINYLEPFESSYVHESTVMINGKPHVNKYCQQLFN